MKNFIFFLLFCTTFIINPAREDPFESVIDANTNAYFDEEGKSQIFTDLDFKLPSTARIITYIKIAYQDINGEIKEEQFPIHKNIDWHYPLTLSQRDAKIDENSGFVNADKMIFFTKENRIYITTNRKLDRNFILPQPFRIILDFEKDPSDTNKSISLNQKYVSKITLTKYDKFYRTSITLDGNYQYKLQKSNDGYEITLE